MFCIDVSFFISIISFFKVLFHSIIHRKQFTEQRKKNVISISFTGRFRRAVVIITGLACATIVCQVDNEGVFMVVDEVIVRLSLLYDLVNVLASVSPPVGANYIGGFSGDLQNVVHPKNTKLLVRKKNKAKK